MLVVYFDVFHAKKAEKARKLRQKLAKNVFLSLNPNAGQGLIIISYQLSTKVFISLTLTKLKDTKRYKKRANSQSNRVA